MNSATPTMTSNSESSSTDDSSTPTTSPEPSKPMPKWGALGYQPVTGLINRHISRYLRTQRKNMRRFFAEHGYAEFFLRLEAIRKNPRTGMIEKNQQFKKVLDDYAVQRLAQTTPVAAPVTETADTHPVSVVDRNSQDAMAVQPTEGRPSGSGVHSGAGVPELARGDADSPVIEE